MKKCSRCKAVKPLGDFNRDKSRRDGLQPRCKTCQLAANREWAERHPETRRNALKRQYAKTPHRPSKRVSNEKRRAHTIVWRALCSGAVTRPEACPACGTSDSPIHAHHDDYSNPLDIKWMCARCHGRFHAEERLTA